MLGSEAIAVQSCLGPVLSQRAGCLTKLGCAGIAVQVLLTLDHEPGCRKVFEGTWRRITGYRIAIKLYLKQNALLQKP
jgi:hypothetical protein